jgi:[ribosomal protein S5]-alanine N-acetyltransferase
MRASSSIWWPKRSRPPHLRFATDSEAIGCIGSRLGADAHRRTAELGYWLGEPFWGRGIMTEALPAFTAWAFPQFDLVRIYAESFANNAASIRLLEKASFTCEGRLRAHVFKDSQILDALLYAKLRDDELVKVLSEPKS